MKPLILYLGSFIVLWTAAIGVSSAAQGKPLSTPEKGITKDKASLSTEKTAGRDKNKDPTSDTAVIVNRDGSADRKSDAKEAQQNTEIQTMLNTFFSGSLVFAAFVTCGLLFWQSWETRKAAQAAQRSIETVNGENRPWLLIEFGDSISNPILVSDTAPASCSFNIKNYGRTPAQLLTIKADMAIGDNPKAPPVTDIIEIGSRFNPQIFPQGEVLVQQAELFAKSAWQYREAVVSNPEETGKYLWLRGIIEYEHTIKAAGVPNYRTEFSYVWQKMGMYWRLIRSTAV